MSRVLRFRVSPAMGVALAALVVASSGVAFATVQQDPGVVATIDSQRPYVEFAPSKGGVKTLAAGGIQSVKRIATGKVCVRPTANFEQTGGMATAEYSNNKRGLAIAFVKTRKSDCPKFSLEVITGRLNNGAFKLSDEVAGANPEG